MRLGIGLIFLIALLYQTSSYATTTGYDDSHLEGIDFKTITRHTCAGPVTNVVRIRPTVSLVSFGAASGQAKKEESNDLICFGNTAKATCQPKREPAQAPPPPPPPLVTPVTKIDAKML